MIEQVWEMDAGERARQRRQLLLRRGAAFCAMLAAAMVYRADTLTHWDSWDYAAQAVSGQSSDLLLGRWWFIAAMRAAWLAGRALFGLSDLHAHLAMQAANMLMLGAAVVLAMAWVRRLTGSATAEALLAVLLVTGPNLGIHGAAVMTEAMTLLMLAAAFWTWEVARAAGRGRWAWAMLGGMCFGVATDIREPAGLLCAWPILSCLVDRPRGRWGLLGAAAAGAVLTLGLGVVEAWAWYPRTCGFFRNIVGWTQNMASERRQFGISALVNLKFVAIYGAFACPGVALLAGPATVWCGLAGRRRLMWLSLAGLPYLGSLLMNHDFQVNSRFVLPLVLMPAPAVAAMLAAGVAWRARRPRLRLAAAALAVAALGAVPLTVLRNSLDVFYFQEAEGKARLLAAMSQLPPRAAVIPGPGTAVAYYLNRIGRTQFEVIASGWAWPGPLLAHDVATALRCAPGGVFVDIRTTDWISLVRQDSEWSQLSAVLANYDLGPGIWPMAQVLPKSSQSQPAFGAGPR